MFGLERERETLSLLTDFLLLLLAGHFSLRWDLLEILKY